MYEHQWGKEEVRKVWFGLREAQSQGSLPHVLPVEGEISQLADCLTGGWSRCVVSSASER